MQNHSCEDGDDREDMVTESCGWWRRHVDGDVRHLDCGDDPIAAVLGKIEGLEEGVGGVLGKIDGLED
ncbi:hypothetical protein RHMOL_Rhmol01G0184200 [Rhododendron molle]|uniref:Uncharacterized protein n=1 Tax=Rhododendron molle TaxID=49168 RepID=A0ACC0Q4S4_RHOML|nr:hypothetical protein RHMOL_Rhmol01G0184200 [Rhododendron molle]